MDDDLCIRQLSTEVLIDSGYEVDSAEDGAAAWQVARLASLFILRKAKATS